MNYRYDFEDGMYHITETPTGTVVSSRKTKEEAKALTKLLNSGGGFDGFTPEFFTLPYKKTGAEAPD